MSESLLAALRPARARLDLDRLAANYLAVAAAAGRPVMPVVKADA
jgi:alanine racemase